MAKLNILCWLDFHSPAVCFLNQMDYSAEFLHRYVSLRVTSEHYCIHVVIHELLHLEQLSDSRTQYFA